MSRVFACGEDYVSICSEGRLITIPDNDMEEE